MPTFFLDFLPGEEKFMTHCKNADTETVFAYVYHTNYVFRRDAAIALLLRGGEEILNKGMELCSHSDFKVRQMGVLIVGEIAIPDTEQFAKFFTLLQNIALTDSSARVRAEAIRALGLRCEKNAHLCPDVLPAFFANITSRSVAVRWSITGALVHFITKEAIPLLEQLLDDPDTDIRNWAAFAATMTGLDSKKIRTNLLKMVKEPYYDARCEAITALAVRRDTRVIPALKKELAAKKPRDSMIKAAASLGDPSFIPVLESLLEKCNDDDGWIQQAIDTLKNLPQ